ncbi:PKD repeat-containing protein [Hydrobacter penzbergensis]|uniref:PKD repeat-containing protein n=1 Tax=Hydrobacter penzbergensis TaxID=1235997 RepID=A0A8X8IIJ8_9BACT|nr:PKD domain-containing protein [Hydrobacter penzbergensis]SDX51196.1 PKD repeat-containing protein [Hydrobacter penzbergensis]
MQQTQFNYPEFVPDQLLTSGNLNELFGYLEEQERITRTNLLGIGIVCGLEARTNTSGTELTITKGCGVTSDGYLVSFPETTYTQYKAYDPVKQKYYERFVDIKPDDKSKKLFDLDELVESAVAEKTTSLTAAYLADKVVLLYVELLEENAKNCNPNSCDDKGKEVTITFKPLLVIKAVADKWLSQQASGSTPAAYLALPILKMHRFNIIATQLRSSGQVLEEYRKILTPAFIGSMQNAFIETYKLLSPLVKDLYGTNPFAKFSQEFAFLYTTINQTEAINLQYYYDLFSDLVLAYEELRETGMEIISMCSPDHNLFRLHLLLDLAIHDAGAISSQYRTYFIPSPILGCHCKQTVRLRWLFKRMVLMLQNFFISLSAKGGFGASWKLEYEMLVKRSIHTSIRITPSRLGNIELAEKSIPFYYQVAQGKDKLYEAWSLELSQESSAREILSYHADEYANDDYTKNPLRYDLEPYNFLRIEGHIGQPYKTALRTILGIRNQYRLPFDVIALSADINSLKTSLESLGKMDTVSKLIEQYAEQLQCDCEFQDLEALYDTLSAELTCTLCKEAKYYYDISITKAAADVQPAAPKFPLLKKCDPTFKVKPGTLGYEFEQYYARTARISAAEYMMYSYDNRAMYENAYTQYFALLLSMGKLVDTLTLTLGTFNQAHFDTAYTAMLATAERIRVQITNAAGALSAERAQTLVHIDQLIAVCIQKQIDTLYRDYLLRWVYVMMLQKFGYFIQSHPGIQHKAGVPVGGTFILVYHEKPIGYTPIDIAKGEVMLAENAGMRTAVEKKYSVATHIKDLLGNIPMGSRYIGGSRNIYKTPVKTIEKEPVEMAPDEFKIATEKQLEALHTLLDTTHEKEIDLDKVLSNLANYTVIADFYLPYLCCSDCPPVLFTVNELVVQPKINITPTTFCSGDSKTYPIDSSPAGGEVTGEGVTKDNNNKYGFTPNAIKLAPADKEKHITLTYTINEQTVTIAVDVFQQPVAAFDVKINGTSASFINKSSAFADKWIWDFGNGKTATEKEPVFNFGTDGDYNVSLIAVNGACNSEKVTKKVTITTPDLTITIPKNSFCANDKPVEVTGTPAGGTVSGEGITKDTAGKFMFNPANVLLQGADQKKLTLTYATAGKSKGTDVTVYAEPKASFAVTNGSTPSLKLFRNTSVPATGTVAWNFGDGKTSNEANPSHDFQKEGSYTVSLTVSNGSCAATATQTVKIVLPVVKTCYTLNNAITAFNTLNTTENARLLDQATQKAFTTAIVPFFKDLKGIDAMGAPDKQLKAFQQMNTVTSMTNWIRMLVIPYLELTNSRLQNMELARILTDIAFYIACIQPADMDKAQVLTNTYFTQLNEYLGRVNAVARQFTADQKKQLQPEFNLFLNDVKAEEERVTTNKETTVKPLYTHILAGYIPLLSI